MYTKTRIAIGLGAIVAAMIVVPALAGSGNGRLMQMKMHVSMKMPGMAVPARTVEHEVCMPTGKFDPKAMQDAMNKAQAKCEVTNFTHIGSKITYDVACTSPVALKSHSVVQVQGEDAFSGTSHTTMDMGGQTMTSEAEYSAKRIGRCDYTPPASS